VVTATPETDVLCYSKAAQAPAQNHDSDVWTIELVDAFRITLMSPSRYRDRYGKLCAEENGRNSFFGAVVFKTADVARIRDLAGPLPDVRSATGAHSLILLAPSLNTVFEFRREP
jgi:hypothetical protein